MQDEARLGEIIRAHPYLTAALEAARDIAAPDWLVSAGAIRDAVWDAANQAAVHLWYAERFGIEVEAFRSAVYRRRLEEKGWRERWPRLRFS